MTSSSEKEETRAKSVNLWNVRHVNRVYTDPGHPKYPNPLSMKPNSPLCWFVDDDDAVAAKVNVDLDSLLQDGIKAEAFTLAGPRLDIVFEPKKCKAAVVTCGGLCPGEKDSSKTTHVFARFH